MALTAGSDVVEQRAGRAKAKLCRWRLPTSALRSIGETQLLPVTETPSQTSWPYTSSCGSIDFVKQ